MPNSKMKEAKIKKRKRLARLKRRVVEERKNAKKNNQGSWILSGTFPE